MNDNAELIMNDNVITATGRVVTLRESNGNVILTLVTKNGNDVYIRFRCTAEMVAQLQYHARVRVTGHIESYLRKAKDSSNRTIVQYFVADSVVPDTTLVEDAYGIKGKFFAPPSARLYLKGTMVSVIMDSKDWIRYILRVDCPNPNTGTRSATIRVSMKRADRQPEIKPGDTVCMACYLSSPVKEENGKKLYMEDLIVADIAKV